jgi:hypothetical protein
VFFERLVEKKRNVAQKVVRQRRAVLSTIGATELLMLEMPELLGN